MSYLFFDFIARLVLLAQHHLCEMPLDIDVFVPSAIEQRDEPLALVVGIVVNHEAEIAVENYEIIHEHLKSFDVQLVLQEIDQHRHVKVGRELRDELADGDAHMRVVVHERLVGRQPMP